MRNELTHYILLTKRLGISLIIFLICKLIFLVYNYHYFSHFSLITLASSFFYGLRFDISAIVLINSPIILLHILPFNFRNSKNYQKLIMVFFVFFNSLALIFELVEVVNFNAVSIRFDYEIFGVAGDVVDQFVSYLKEFWYVIVVCVAMFYGMAKLYNYLTQLKTEKKQNPVIQMVLMFLALVFFGIGARGGIQSKAIGTVNSMQYTNSVLSPMVYNTCFSIGSSLIDRYLDEKNYFTSDEELTEHFNQTRCYFKDSMPQKKMNVVVIILESFSKYFVQSLSHEKEKCTPFLDSLINSGTCYVAANGYANARHSHEGHSAILTSIPVLMLDPFMTSVYQENKVNSYVNILKKYGYYSAYFHASKNGSLRLDEMAKECGFDSYYGLNEYPNKNHYDGNWGIFDDKFFPFCADKINGFKEPFTTTIFNLSSHFPFTMPEEFKNSFGVENAADPQIPMIRYTDYVLKQFFKKIKSEPWYENTLFVFTADHTYHELSENPTELSKFSIPILFFSPKDTSLKKKMTFPVNQVDVMPSILDYLNVPDTFKCFGNSIFSPIPSRYAFNFEKGLYQLVEKDALLQFDGVEAVGFYDLKTDPFQRSNAIKSKDPRIALLTKRIKAVIQTYNGAMIRNELF